jgi:hypothetical protein
MAAPLRIQPPSGGLAGAGAGDGGNDVKFYLERLVKLIPAEVLSLYLVGHGIIPQGDPTPNLVWAGVGVILVVLARAYATADPAQNVGPQWIAVGVAAVSFVIWVYVTGAIDIPNDPTYVGPLVMLVWTFVVPYFYKG